MHIDGGKKAYGLDGSCASALRLSARLTPGASSTGRAPPRSHPVARCSAGRSPPDPHGSKKSLDL